MTINSDTQRPTETTTTPAGRVTAGLVLAGATFFAVGDLLRRTVDADARTPGALTRAVQESAGVWLCAGLLSLAAGLLLVFGITGVLRAAPAGRGRATVQVGAVLVGVGAGAAIGHANDYYGSWATYARAGVSAHTATVLDKAGEGYPLSVVLILMFIVGMTVGPVVLLVGLRMAGRVPVWSVVAAVLFAVLGSTSSVALGAVGVVAAWATFGPVALAMLTRAE